jgi:hypothetical protein
MKRFHLFALALLLAASASPALASPDTAGSSTDQTAGANEGRTTYTNVHSGREVTAAEKVGNTDAAADEHPFVESTL